MTVLEVNTNILNQIYGVNPNCVQGMSLEGNDLIYNGQRVDISGFDISSLFSDIPGFQDSLNSLSSEDLFRIIRLHANILGDTKGTSKSEKSIENDVEVIKQENPLLKQITTVTKDNGFGKDQYINIVDSNGTDHLFKIDRNDFDLLSYYEELKVRKGNELTAEDLIYFLNYHFKEIRLDSSSTLLNSSEISEDFENKTRRIVEENKSDSEARVLGNESDDIVVVKNGNGGHEVKTFDHDDNGNLTVDTHATNVSGTDTTTIQGDKKETSSDNVINNEQRQNEVVSDNEIKKNDTDEVLERLIPIEEFESLFDPRNMGSFSEEERKNVDLYYAYFGELILYEEYLLPELQQLLATLRNFVTMIESSVDSLEQLTERQAELVSKREELENNKKNVLENGEHSLEQAKENVKKLEYKYPGNNSGSVVVLQVIAIILGFAIILTAMTIWALN